MKVDLGTISEKETIRLAQDGNEDAFTILYQRNLDAVYRYILKRVGEVYEAENITQTVFTKAWMALDRYKPTVAPFRAWLYRIAHNAVVDHYRKQKDAVLWDDLLSVPDTRRTPEEVILSQERSAQVHEAMAEIKPVYKEVLSHRFLSNMDYAETAEVLDRKVNAVRVLQHRALNALQKTLSQQVVTWVAIFAIFASLGLGRQAVRAAEGALPGDLLYGIKVRVEDTLLSLYDDAGDARLYTSYTARRLDEIEALLEADRLDDVQTTAARFTAQLEEASAAIATVAQINSALAEELAAPLNASLDEQKEALSELGSSESTQMQSLLQSVIDTAEDVQSTINRVTPQPAGTDEPPTSQLEDEGDDEAAIVSVPPTDDGGGIGNSGKRDSGLAAESNHDKKAQTTDALDVSSSAAEISTPEREQAPEGDPARAESRSAQAVPTNIPSDRNSPTLSEGSSIEAAGSPGLPSQPNQPARQESGGSNHAEDAAPEAAHQEEARVQQPKESRPNGADQPVVAAAQPDAKKDGQQNGGTGTNVEITSRDERPHETNRPKHHELQHDSAADAIDQKSMPPRDEPPSDRPSDELHDDKPDRPDDGDKETNRSEKDTQENEPSTKSHGAPPQDKNGKPNKH